MTIRDESSSSSRSADTSIKLAPAEWEIAKRLATILYDNTVNDLFERAIVEACAAAGVIALNDAKTLPMPSRADSLEAGVRATATFANAVTKRITEVRGQAKAWEKRIFFLRPKTRAHLVKQLALFPARRDVAFEPPPYRPDGESAPTVTKIRLRPMHMTAAKAAAAALYGGNLSALVHKALEEKASSLGMQKRGANHPTFQAYPSPTLLSLQRNLEEPALALVVGLDDVGAALAKAPKKPRGLDELTEAAQGLFEALLALIPPDATAA